MTTVLGPGAVFAGYRLERVIGQGGMGVVYEATQLSLKRTIAIKLVSPAIGSDVSFRRRFEREGPIQARIEHPNIVSVYEAGEFEGTLFIAMRMVHGVSLKDVVATGPLDCDRTLRLLGPVADALDCAHEAGLIHRDIKPHNILVGSRDHAYLADFGLAKTNDATAVTRTGQFVGSLDYVSPEQIHGEPVTAASDIYALGAVLFECLTGAVPYPRDTEAAVLFAHISETPPRVSERRPELPASLDDVIARAMAKAPSDRPASAVELIDDAARAIDEAEPVRAQTTVVKTPAPKSRTSSSPRATGPRAASAPRVRRRRRVAALGALALVAVGVAAAGFALGHSGTRHRATPPTPMRSAAAGHVGLAVPASWSAPAQTPSIRGLPMRDELALEDRATGGVLVAGRLRGGQGDRLLPAAFLRRLRHRPGLDDAVRLGNADAYRYRELSPTGLRSLMVVPTSAGVVAIGCMSAPAASRRFVPSCEHAAGTLKLKGARALALGPDRSYGRRLTTAVNHLRASGALSDALTDAKTPDGQAKLYRRLAAAQQKAATALAAAKPGPDAAALHHDLLAAIRAAAHDYRRLATAASGSQPKNYSAARSDADADLATIDSRLTALRAIGYGT